MFEETDDSACMEVSMQEIVSDESDVEHTQEEESITTYQQTINLSQQLTRFVESHGDLSAFELIST